MNSAELQDAEKQESNSQWDILIPDSVDNDFFSKNAFAERMNKCLNSINADSFMDVIRGYRKHLSVFQQKFSKEQFREKYDNSPDLLNVYAFSVLVKDYLSKHLRVGGVDLEIKKKDYNNTAGGHLNIRTGKIYINFDYHTNGTLGDVAKTIAHEMWHVKQAVSSIEEHEDGSVTRTPYFNALLINYTRASSDYDSYYNQDVEKEAREFADAFERKIFSDNPSYEAWMQERYGFPSEYYGRLATDIFFDSIVPDYWYDEQEY